MKWKVTDSQTVRPAINSRPGQESLTVR
jgi:hypothetical protein